MNSRPSCQPAGDVYCFFRVLGFRGLGFRVSGASPDFVQLKERLLT